MNWKFRLERRLIVVMMISLIALVSPLPAAAQPPLAGTTIKVTVFTDDNVRNGNCTLREAIQAANVNVVVDRCPAGSATETDTIQLVAGTYLISVQGSRENGNFKGDFDVWQNINILGAGKANTIIDAQGIDRVFQNRTSSSTLRIKDLTIQNGKTGQDGSADHGGAIVNYGTLLVTRVRFFNNQVTSNTEEKGGAIYNAGRMELTDTDFEKSWNDEDGGAIANTRSAKLWRVNFNNNYSRGGAAVFNSGTGAAMEIHDSKFLQNVCGTGYGSAILQKVSGSMLIENTVFDQNGTCDGEVIHNDATMTIRKSIFTANNSEIERIVILNTAGTLNVSDTQFNGNGKVNQNGTVTPATSIAASGGRVTIERTTMSANQGTNLSVSGTGWVRVGNSTLTGAMQKEGSNVAGVTISAGTLYLESVTLAENHSDTGGALAVTGGTVTLHNTILTGSLRMTDGAPVADCTAPVGAIVSRGYNLVGRSDGCNWKAAAGDQLGTAAAPIDPKLDVLKDNGGPTPTRALLPGSPAIDKADTYLVFPTDQRLYKRLAGPRSDIGAFEANSVPAQ